MTPEAEQPTIFDTSIYYKSLDRIQAWIVDRNLTVYFTPNNVLELITPDRVPKDVDFQKRKNALRNLLELTDGGRRELPDTEVFHAMRLGYHDTSSGGEWAEAARRFLTLDNISPEALQEARLNLQPGLDAITAAYGAFVTKVETCQNIFQKTWAANKDVLKSQGITFEQFYSEYVIREIIDELAVVPDIAASHVDRICAVAKTYELTGALVPANQYDSAIGIYIRAYTGYLIYALKTRKRDKNDFGDLQFFTYCDGGFKLATTEDRWHTIGAQENMQDHLLFFR